MGPSPELLKTQPNESHAGDTPPTEEDFLRWLDNNSSYIIEEWVDRLAMLSPYYKQRPTSELYRTCTEAFRANFEMLEKGKRERIDKFIDFITRLRLEAGFPLSDVQKAFELFREIVLEELLKPKQLSPYGAWPGIAQCRLAYTIHKFSDLFQRMHENAIRRHARNLERTVRLRTAELTESERRYKTLVNEINDGYFIIQGERIAFANQTFCQMHGVSMEEIQGKRFINFVTPDCRESVIGVLRNSLVKRATAGPLEYTRTGCPREQAATEIKSRVVDLGHGPVTIGICRDISSRVSMEAQIREHERMAYVGHIAASLSHEIRNPLSTCTLNMLIMKERLNLSGFDRRRLEITVKELTRLEEILLQLLDIARPLDLKPAPVDLAAVARDCVDLLAARAAEKSLTMKQRHAPDLPLVPVDQGKMEQAVLNLMLNAVDAVHEGGRIILWTRACKVEGNEFVELGVHDNGAGIEEDQMEHLFTPFVTTKSRGTGLGLSNVKRIIEAHAGTVRVKSRPGLGATFCLRLPWVR
jgi:PAS domain S-box-containing protein